MNPGDPSDVEAATLQHRRPADVQDSEFGHEAERPAYDDAVAEEIGGDYDHAEQANYNEDDGECLTPPGYARDAWLKWQSRPLSANRGRRRRARH